MKQILIVVYLRVHTNESSCPSNTTLNKSVVLFCCHCMYIY